MWVYAGLAAQAAALYSGFVPVEPEPAGARRYLHMLIR